jgi:hypothetical protein
LLLPQCVDLVLWDSHPLALGATPIQVFIDGIAQLESPHVVHKPRSFQKPPIVPTFSREAAEAVEYEGLPLLEPKRADSDVVIFENVKNLFLPTVNGIQNVLYVQSGEFGVVVVRNGSILCSGLQASCLTSEDPEIYRVVDLQGEMLYISITGVQTN